MDTDFARRQMIGQQVRAWEVFDPAVLEVIAEVPREFFVPPQFHDLAFADTQIPLAHGQKMMTPSVEGRVLQALGLTVGDRVLEIGTGSAYLTACLARRASSVCSVDIFEDFLSAAHGKLAEISVSNVELIHMDASRELPQGEFDAIAVTGSLPRFDDRLFAKLRPGGRLFAIVGESPVQEARIIVRSIGPDWTSAALFETSVDPLINFVATPGFAF